MSYRLYELPWDFEFNKEQLDSILLYGILDNIKENEENEEEERKIYVMVDTKRMKNDNITKVRKIRKRTILHNKIKKKIILSTNQITIEKEISEPNFTLLRYNNDPKNENKIPMYILFCSNIEFEFSNLNSKKFVLTRMINVDFEFICNNGNFYHLYINGEYCIVYISLQNKEHFKNEIDKLELKIGTIVTKAFLISEYYKR